MCSALTPAERSDIWLVNAARFSTEQVYLAKAGSKVMTAAKAGRPFYGVVVRNSPCNSHHERLAVPVSFTVSNRHNRKLPDVALSANLDHVAEALGLTEAGGCMHGVCGVTVGWCVCGGGVSHLDGMCGCWGSGDGCNTCGCRRTLLTLSPGTWPMQLVMLEE